MGMNAWDVTGYGIDAEMICNVDVSKVIKEVGSEEVSNALAGVTDMFKINDILSEEEPDGYGDWSMILATVLNQRTGIDFTGVYFEEDAAVVLIDRAPWEYTDKDRSLTSEALAEMMKKEMIDLGADPDLFTADDWFGRQSIEFWG